MRCALGVRESRGRRGWRHCQFLSFKLGQPHGPGRLCPHLRPGNLRPGEATSAARGPRRARRGGRTRRREAESPSRTRATQSLASQDPCAAAPRSARFQRFKSRRRLGKEIKPLKGPRPPRPHLGQSEAGTNRILEREVGPRMTAVSGDGRTDGILGAGREKGAEEEWREREARPKERTERGGKRAAGGRRPRGTFRQAPLQAAGETPGRRTIQSRGSIPEGPPCT